MLEKLKNMLDDHRKSAVVTCAPSCMCWSVEGFILVHESQLTPVAGDGASCLCGGKYYFDKVQGEICCRCQSPRA